MQESCNNPLLNNPGNLEGCASCSPGNACCAFTGTLFPALPVHLPVVCSHVPCCFTGIFVPVLPTDSQISCPFAGSLALHSRLLHWDHCLHSPYPFTGVTVALLPFLLKGCGSPASCPLDRLWILHEMLTHWGHGYYSPHQSVAPAPTLHSCSQCSGSQALLLSLYAGNC